MTAPLPIDEEARLAALRRHAILDSDAEPKFDRIVQLAARQFDVPIALISLVDADRQWFKASCGLEERETGRDIAFCAHAILGDAVFVVPDAREDARFQANPLVTGDLGIRFYAGAPLATSDGFKLGTLCLIDSRPRHDFSPREQGLLRDLAGVVADLIEMRLATGNVLGEVEERLRAQRDLEMAEHKIGQFLAYAPAPVALFDRKMCFLAASPSWNDLFGLVEDGVALGRALVEVLPDLPDEWQRQHDCCLAGEALEVDREWIDLSDGRGEWVRRQAFPWRAPDGAVGGVVVFLEVISARVEAERRLERSQRFLSAVLENVRDGIVACDADGRLSYFNQATRDFHGLPARDLPADRWAEHYDLYRGDGQTKLPVEEIPLFRAFAGEKVRDAEMVIAPKDGPKRYIVANGQPMIAPDGEKLGAVVSMHDMTLTRRVGIELRKSKAELELILNSVPVRIFYKDDKNRILRLNEPAARSMGLTVAEAEGADTYDLFPEQARKYHDDDLEVIDTGKPKLGIVEEYTPREGERGWVRTDKVPYVDPETGERYVFVAASDITAEKIAEEKLFQAQKMEAVGELTGGLAHDFNNLLGVVMGNLQLLERSVGDNEKAAKRIAAALAAVDRGAELTRRLLAFSRRQKLDAETLHVNPLVSGMADMLSRTLGERVDVAFFLADDLPPIRTDPSQLESALLNLAVNARDAMPKGGRLTVETELRRYDAAGAADIALAAGRYIVLSVSDTGTGIAPEDLERVFQPFFSTKEVGKGTGLGLSMIYGFMKQAGGTVRIYSEPGIGTTVRLFLPVSTQAMTDRESEDSVPEIRADGTRTVLIVEDQPGVREIADQLIRDLGYRTVCAANGHEALALLKSDSDVDVVFTDIVMPGGMDGTELARAAQELRPDLPFVFTTGFAEAAVLREGKVAAASNLVAKPYRQADIAVKLRMALARGERT